MPGKTRKGSRAHNLLKVIGMTGVFLFSGRNVNRAIWKAQQWGREFEDKQWPKMKKSLTDLRHRGLVTLHLQHDGILKAIITKRGKEIVRQINFDSMELGRPKIWDGLWRIVIFDVPNTKHKQRLAFSTKLRLLGFKMIQKSVWVFPYPCTDELMVMRKFYDIEPYVTYLETNRVEDEDIWRKKFNL